MPQGSPPSPDLTTTVSRAPFACLMTQSTGAIRLSLTGELDRTHLPRFEQTLRAVSTPGSTIVVDLRRLQFIDCAGAHALIRADRRLRTSGGRMVVVRGRKLVAWFFDLISLEDDLELVDRPPNPVAVQRGDEQVPAAIAMGSLRATTAEHVRATAPAPVHLA